MVNTRENEVSNQISNFFLGIQTDGRTGEDLLELECVAPDSGSLQHPFRNSSNQYPLIPCGISIIGI